MLLTTSLRVEVVEELRRLDPRRPAVVIHYDLPANVATYLERAGSSPTPHGAAFVSISLVTSMDMEALRRIEELYTTKIHNYDTTAEVTGQDLGAEAIVQPESRRDTTMPPESVAPMVAPPPAAEQVFGTANAAVPDNWEDES